MGDRGSSSDDAGGWGRRQRRQRRRNRAQVGAEAGGESIWFGVDVTAALTPEALREWQLKCYQQLVDAARAAYEEERARLKQEREDLLAELGREDALMLRKIEKEEL